MEKANQKFGEPTGFRPPATRAKMPRVRIVGTLALALLLTMLYWNFDHIPKFRGFDSQPEKPAPEEWMKYTEIWDSITPSEKLEWQPCYGKVQCARLLVPMDYDKPLNSSCHVPHVAVAMVLAPAHNTTTTDNKQTIAPSARSPMLLNPGGPGGSGTMLALMLGGALQEIFGHDQPIIGFDPRGIGFTTPRADCWAVPPPAECPGCDEDIEKGFFHRIEWEMGKTWVGPISSSDSALRYMNAAQRAVNDLCREKDTVLGATNILEHTSTAHVARDMLSIVDAWDAWQEEVELAVPARKEEIRSMKEEVDPSSTKGKLVYWGFSYGTYLGATFASMFPDRVGRLILDGVVDAEYYVEPLWKESLHDTDRILQLFFENCHNAEHKCDLYRDGDSVADILKRYNSVIAKVEDEPITIIHPEKFVPVVLPAALIKQLVFSVLYSPNVGFPVIATLLNYVHEDQMDKLANLFMTPDLTTFCTIPGGINLAALPGDAQRAIMCSDKTNLVDMTLPEIKEEYVNLNKSSSFADVWIQLLLLCNGWDIHQTSHPPAGLQPHMIKAPSQVKTNFPILFLSNTLDPVTPLIAAVKMALKYQDAGLVEQRSAGHCTISSASLCTAKVVREYIINGKVPPPPMVDGDDYLGGEWTMCDAVEQPWNRMKRLRGKEELEVLETLDVEAKENYLLVRHFQHVQGILEMFPRWGKTHIMEFRKSDQALIMNGTVPENSGSFSLGYGWGI